MRNMDIGAVNVSVALSCTYHLVDIFRLKHVDRWPNTDMTTFYEIVSP